MDNPAARAPSPTHNRSEPVHLSARYGHGNCCAACGCAIGRYELEYELGWVQPARTVRMHARCYEMRHSTRPLNH
jgi:hypothetical protein